MNKRTNIVCVTALVCTLTGCASDGSLHPMAALAGCTVVGVAVAVGTGEPGIGAGAAGGCLAKDTCLILDVSDLLCYFQ